MAKQPYLPLFFGDLLASTAAWEGEERALYILLLAYQWSSGPLPRDPRRLARMAQYDPGTFAQLWATVGQKFAEVGDGLANPRLEEHRLKAVEISNRRAVAGAEGAAKRWQATIKTDGKEMAIATEAMANAKDLPLHPIQSNPIQSNPVQTTQTRAPEVPHGTPEASEAEIFAAVSTIKSHYPKAARENWIGAERTMRQLVGDRLTTWPELLAGVERYAAHVKATGRQVLNPANFFGAEDRPYSQAWPIPAAKPGTNGGTDPEAAAAWSRLLAADGANRTVRDQFALDAIGGWSTVRLRTAFDEPKIRANFCRAWSEAA